MSGERALMRRWGGYLITIQRLPLRLILPFHFLVLKYRLW